jgi:serine/threonine protein kinase
LQPDQSLIFRVWIEFLHKISLIFLTLFEILSFVVKPTFKVIIFVVKGICAVPSSLYVKIYENQSVMKHQTGMKSTSSYDFLKEGHENKHENEFSLEFKDLVFKMLAYNMVDRPSLDQIKDHPWLKGPTPSQD